MKQKMAEFLDALMGFRKFIAFLLIMLVAIIFRIESLIGPGEFADLVKTIGTGFIAANGVEHFTTMVKDYIEARGKPADAVTIVKKADEKADPT